MRNMSWHYFRI